MNRPDMFPQSPSDGRPLVGGPLRSVTAPEGDAEHYRRLLDRLFSMLSHDLRTPLSAISGWLFLLESDKLDAAGRKRALEKIRSNLDEEVRLIDDTLALARSQAGTLRIERSPVAAAPILRAAVDAMLKAAGGRHVALCDLTSAGFEALIEVDGARLQRAIELIIDRALRSTIGSEGRVNVIAIAHADHVEFSIEDNGREIAAAALPHIFDPFGPPTGADHEPRHSADRSLLVAAALIEAQGGRVSAMRGREGAGSKFSMVFPRPSL